MIIEVSNQVLLGSIRFRYKELFNAVKKGMGIKRRYRKFY